MRNISKMFKMAAITSLLFFGLVTQGWSQVIVLQEDFSSGALPTGWSTQVVSGTYNWVFNSVGGYLSHPPAAHSAPYNAMFRGAGYNNDESDLITPVLNLGAYTYATLSFWHTQENWYGDQDELTVFYRASAADPWTQLATYTSSIDVWTYRSLVLPNPTSTYQIRFNAWYEWGYGVCLDDVMVSAPPPPPPPLPPQNITIGTGTSTQGQPYYVYYHDGRTQLLYTAAEIIAAG